MKKFTINIILFLVFTKLTAQQFLITRKANDIFSVEESIKNDFNSVDSVVRGYTSEYISTETLANQIKKDFKTDKDKIRALYTWLCLNISYDMVSFTNGQTAIGFSYSSRAEFNRKMKAINKNIVNNTLRSKKAVCEGYAQTFKEVSEQLEIPCKIIGGYAKGNVSDINNPPSQENHAWNAVKIDEKWYLIDTTWGAGNTNGKKWKAKFDDFYFFTEPNEFILTHCPTESEWAFTETSLTKKEFFNKPIYKKSFFTNPLKLISPKSGVIEVSTNNDITFLIGQIPQDINLFYAFKGDKYSKKIQIDCNNTQCNFAIPYTKNNDTELYIFANQKPILEFKVKKKT